MWLQLAHVSEKGQDWPSNSSLAARTSSQGVSLSHTHTLRLPPSGARRGRGRPAAARVERRQRRKPLVLASTQSLLDSLLGDRPPERALSLPLSLPPPLFLLLPPPGAGHGRGRPAASRKPWQRGGSGGSRWCSPPRRRSSIRSRGTARRRRRKSRYASGPVSSASRLGAAPSSGHRWPPPPSFSPAGAVASVGSMRAWLRAEEDVRRKEAVTKWIQHSLEGGGVRMRRHGSF
ncbi:hypothetical protein GQ55_9G371700 [Panicum hallii var. hallii]|uniref:Uncharacterized protein n=1 Tax=Panicum hallii var. hallii TaxID=1504633 RepID=A0A2T7C8Y9_9POAL|nr:hypothetical protein GQ55_9G371700 [Panicum hallii var. hallii]